MNLQSEQLDEFFQRLNKPLAKLPAQERADIHAEVRQHLDALVAAHEELGATPSEALAAAIQQFGDPTQVGQRMAREWERKNCLPARMNWRIGLFFVLWLNGFDLVECFIPGLLGEWVLHQSAALLTVLHLLFQSGPLLLAGALTGRWAGRVAIPHIFYATLTNYMSSTFIFYALGLAPRAGHFSHLSVLLTFLYNYTLYFPTLAAISCAAAYLSSAGREGGWYKLRGSDLKLRLR